MPSLAAFHDRVDPIGADGVLLAAALAAGADPDQPGPDGWTPLAAACAAVRAPGTTRPTSAVRHAAIAGLLRAGADPDLRTTAGCSCPGWPPLLIALGDGDPVAVDMLLHAGADPSMATTRGLCAAHPRFASGDGLRGAAIAALAAAGRIDAPDAEGAALLAAWITDDPPPGVDPGPVIASLLDAGADPSAMDASGWTPAGRAVVLRGSAGAWAAPTARMLAAGAIVGVPDRLPSKTLAMAAAGGLAPLSRDRAMPAVARRRAAALAAIWRDRSSDAIIAPWPDGIGSDDAAWVVAHIATRPDGPERLRDFAAIAAITDIPCQPSSAAS